MARVLDEATVEAHIARVREAESRILELMAQLEKAGATPELLEELNQAIAEHVAARTDPHVTEAADPGTLTKQTQAGSVNGGPAK